MDRLNISIHSIHMICCVPLFGDVTICKHTYLKKDGSLTEKEIAKWKDVRILSIDGISFMKDSELKSLATGSKRLKSVLKSLEGFQLSSQESFVNLTQYSHHITTFYSPASQVNTLKTISTDTLSSTITINSSMIRYLEIF